MSAAAAAGCVAVATLLLASIHYVWTTAARHNVLSGRLWSGGLFAFCAAGLAQTLQVLKSAHDPYVGAVTSACFLLGAGLFWSALRSLRNTDPRAVPVVALTVVVLAVRTAASTADPVTLDLLESVAALVAAGFAALAAAEARRHRGGDNLNAVLLQWTLVLLTGSLVSGALLFSMHDHGQTWTAVTACIVVVIALQALVALRAERDGAWWSDDVELQRTFGVYSRRQFDDVAADRLERLRTVGADAGMLLVAIDDLDGVRAAFGRGGGDQALGRVAALIRRHAPAWGQVGYFGGGVFAVLHPTESPARTREVAVALERALYADHPDGWDGVPVSAVVACTDTFEASHHLASLTGAAKAALARAQGETMR